ncbi:MAG: coproporphyrinogen-III oxidase family protein [Bacteriovoracia bacterium]
MTTVSSLYVHVPFCRHLCNYCDFYKQKFERPRAQLEEFSAYLQASWKRHESILTEQKASWGPLQTLYFGGGTPSLWGVDGAQEFSHLLEQGLSLAPHAEVTFEIDPGAWTEEGLLAWENIGVNRYSVGTQSLNEHYLKVLDRAHDRSETFRLLERLKGKNFSVDFLLGAPEVNHKRDVISELTELLSYGPKHVSLYILQPAAGYKLKTKIPDDEVTSNEYLAVSEFLRSRGFHHYEVSNFGLPGFESRHNLRYWMGENVAALGPTGTGYLASSNESALRYKWKPGSAEIESENLQKTELEMERLYLRLRLSRPFTSAELVPNPQILEELLTQWQSRKLVIKEGAAWRMQPAAWVILDSLINEYFSSLQKL